MFQIKKWVKLTLVLSIVMLFSHRCMFHVPRVNFKMKLEEPEKCSHTMDKVRKLGQGTYGEVWQVKMKDSGETRALKYMNSKDAKRIQMEIDNVRVLQNTSNVYRFFGTCEAENQTTGLLLEYLEGGDLKNYVKKRGGEINEEEARMIIFQLLTGLQSMADMNYVHLDLKPENVAFSVDGDICSLKIVDVGTANFLQDFENDRLKPIYTSADAAPVEVVNQNYGSRMDVYSVGVITAKILYGVFKPGFKGYDRKFRQDWAQFIDEFRNEILEIAKERGSPYVYEFIRKALQKESERPSIKNMLNDPWFQDWKSPC